MAFSLNLAYNHDASDGLNEWVTSNVAVVSGNFVLGPAAASMSQTRDLSILDFIAKGFKVVINFEYLLSLPTIQDFAILEVTYEDTTKEYLHIPLRAYSAGQTSVEAYLALRKKSSAIVIKIIKASTSGSLVVNDISYFHDDNPFTLIEEDKPENSIITDAYGIHIYEGNVFEGGTLRVSLGEYSAEEFGLLIKGKNAETIINEFGINPKFLDYSKNLTWNSSFEVFDSDFKPLFWFISGTGVCSQDSTFYSDRSLKLSAGALARQTWAARTKPWWINNQDVRVSMYINFVQPVEVRVVDIGRWVSSGATEIRYYGLWDGTLPKPDPLPTTLTFSGANGWEGSRVTFMFDSSEFLSEQPPSVNDDTAFALEIENVGTGDVYIDGVMAHVDFTGSWAQLYKDGPRSTSVQSVGNFYTNPDPLDPEETVFLDGVPLTNLTLYDDGMILTLLDGTVTEYDFTLDVDDNITALTNGTTGIVTVINDVGGAKP